MYDINIIKTLEENAVYAMFFFHRMDKTQVLKNG